MFATKASLEDEIEEILKIVHSLNPELSYRRGGREKGKSGSPRQTDFVLFKNGLFHAIIESKDVHVRNIKNPTSTFDTHMCRAYARLNDLGLINPNVGLLVIVREFLPSRKQTSKYANLFSSIGAGFLSIDMVRKDPVYHLYESNRTDIGKFAFGQQSEQQDSIEQAQTKPIVRYPASKRGQSYKRYLAKLRAKRAEARKGAYHNLLN